MWVIAKIQILNQNLERSHCTVFAIKNEQKYKKKCCSGVQNVALLDDHILEKCLILISILYTDCMIIELLSQISYLVIRIESAYLRRCGLRYDTYVSKLSNRYLYLNIKQFYAIFFCNVHQTDLQSGSLKRSLSNLKPIQQLMN